MFGRRPIIQVLGHEKEGVQIRKRAALHW